MSDEGIPSEEAVGEPTIIEESTGQPPAAPEEIPPPDGPAPDDSEA